MAFSFKGQSWDEVLEWLADISGMSLQMEDSPPGTLSLTTRGRYTADEARDLVNSVLLSRGFTLMCDGELLRVAKLEGLDHSLVPRVAAEELETRGAYELVKVLIDLDWLEAESVVDEIKQLLSPHGKVTALKATNRLDVLDTADNVRRIRDFLSAEQVAGQERSIRKFTLRHIRAAHAIDILHTLLGLESEDEPAAAVPPVQPGMSSQQAQQAALLAQRNALAARRSVQAVKRLAESDSAVSLAVDARENSILARAPADKMTFIEQAIRVIDLPRKRPAANASDAPTLRTYTLTAIAPATVIRVLGDLGALDPATWVDVDARSQSIVVYAPASEHSAIEALIKQLDAEASARTRPKVEIVRLAVPMSAVQVQQLLGVLGYTGTADQSQSGTQTNGRSPGTNKSAGGPDR